MPPDRKWVFMEQAVFPKKSIIAAVRTENEWKAALNSRADVLFLLSGTISALPELLNEAHLRHKKLFWHLDMIDGLAKDAAGVEYVSHLSPDGIISTRGNLIKFAKSCGLCTVQRFFIVDGRSVETALDTLRQTKPMFAELMPGLVCKTVRTFSETGLPIIAGGLVTTPEEVRDAFEAGAYAVSTSARLLW